MGNREWDLVVRVSLVVGPRLSQRLELPIWADSLILLVRLTEGFPLASMVPITCGRSVWGEIDDARRGYIYFGIRTYSSFVLALVSSVQYSCCFVSLVIIFYFC